MQAGPSAAADEEKVSYDSIIGTNSSTSSVHDWQILHSDGQEKSLTTCTEAHCGCVPTRLTGKHCLLLGMLVTAIALAFFPSSKPVLSWGKLVANGSTVDIVLDIANKEVQPDGFRRVAVLAGGTFPGRPILATKGQKVQSASPLQPCFISALEQGTVFKINVINNLTNGSLDTSTSVHWHGIFQQDSNWADGTSFVTQCPITSGHSFQYDFTVPSQVGTYWYHSHFSTQYCDGLRGALVIYDPDDPYRMDYDIDDENTIITLSDWYHELSSSFTPAYQVEANSTLINGKGRYTNGPAMPLAVINVQKSKRYRFRIIAMSCDRSFIFSVDLHNLTIIEADGEYTNKLTVDSIEIFAGQRYSVILNADKPVANYWIRANLTAKTPGFKNGTAILRYAGAPMAEPATDFNSERPFKEVDLHTKFDPKPPGEPCVGCADVNINLVQNYKRPMMVYEINGASFHPPTVPVLLQVLNGAGKDLFPKGSIYRLPSNKTIEISIPGFKDWRGPHPYHLHGHSFWVVRSANSDTYNWVNPVRRDTVNTGLAGSNATFRFVTDNAGPWFLHCHIDWHLETGLAVVFAEDIEHTQKQSYPHPWQRLCPRFI